jgi:hypothetical protein
MRRAEIGTEIISVNAWRDAAGQACGATVRPDLSDEIRPRATVLPSGPCRSFASLRRPCEASGTRHAM